MGSLILLLIVVVAVAVVLAVLKAKLQGGTDDEAWPFYAKNLCPGSIKFSTSGLSGPCLNIPSLPKFNFRGCSA